MQDETVQPGYCECGCGARTGVWERDSRTVGRIKGEPKRFIDGHGNGRPAEERFWEKVDQHGPNGCWEWLARKDRDGYGRFRAGNTQVNAHRFAYELLVGPIKPGLEIDHLCRNKGCVNPTHLEPVTTRENVLRGYNRAAINARKTHCIYGHEFNDENTYLRTDGARTCRTCQSAYQVRYRARKRK